jgi:hypothetical protein
MHVAQNSCALFARHERGYKSEVPLTRTTFAVHAVFMVLVSAIARRPLL